MATATQVITATPTIVSAFDSDDWSVQNRGPGSVRFAQAASAPDATSNDYKEIRDGQFGTVQSASGEHVYFWKDTRFGPTAVIAWDQIQD